MDALAALGNRIGRAAMARHKKGRILMRILTSAGRTILATVVLTTGLAIGIGHAATSAHTVATYGGSRDMPQSVITHMVATYGGSRDLPQLATAAYVA
jgi:hypothetical protein